MLEKLNKLTNWQAVLIITVIGFAVFAIGLPNHFLGFDDQAQIIDNSSVHSISNLKTFFQDNTYTGASDHLIGAYYRPLMQVFYATIFTLFGPSPFAFHLLQLWLNILCAFFLFLVFKYFMKPHLSLFLALIFLVHPINSQSVYSIAALQEPIFFLFGIMALWTLICFQDKSPFYLLLTSVLLFLSLLGKETGILFTVICLLYISSRRQRFFGLLAISITSTIAYLVLRTHAIGLANTPHTAPIDFLSFWQRLINIPAIIAFYITRFLFPYKLAHAYYWAYRSITFSHFVIPLTFDIACFVGLTYVGMKLREKNQHYSFYMYIFFGVWFLLGLVLLLQIIPLDFTVSEEWFYFPIAGLLGMFGVTIEAYSYKIRISSTQLTALAISLVIILGIRSGLRGPDWYNTYRLAFRDSTVSKQDYVSEAMMAYYLEHQGNFSDALPIAKQSISSFPSYLGYDALGLADTGLGNYQQAIQVFDTGLTFQSSQIIVTHLGAVTLWYGDDKTNRQFLMNALRVYPRDPQLWFYLAVLDNRIHDNIGAKYAISQTEKYTNQFQVVYKAIMQGQSLQVRLDNRPPLSFQ